MNIPNIITTTRICLIPVYLYLFYSDLQNKWIYTGIIFILIGISDFLDGYIARKYNLVSKLGTLLDPLADKLFVFAVLGSFTSKNTIPFWVFIVMIIKEVLLITGASLLYVKGLKVIASDRFGKIATIFFYITIFSFFLEFNNKIFFILLLITIIFNILAFINYLKKFLEMTKGV